MQRCSLRAVAEGEEEQKGISFSANRNAVSAYVFEVGCRNYLLPWLATLVAMGPKDSSLCLMQARGYTDEDSAGQSNIFAVEVSQITERTLLCSTPNCAT